MIERSRVIKKRKKGFTCSQISTRKFIVDKNLCKNSVRIIDVEKLKSNFNIFIYICRSIVCNLPNKRIENQNKYIDVKFSIIDVRRGIIVVNVSNVYNFDACLNQYGTCRRRERFVYNRVESSKILSLKFSVLITVIKCKIVYELIFFYRKFEKRVAEPKLLFHVKFNFLS